MTDGRQRAVIITLYRRLQLLTLDYNECYAQVFLPMTMIAVMIGGVSSLFILIRLHSEVPVVGIVFFGVKIVIILGMFNFVFGFGGRILAGSRELIETCGKIEGLQKHKWFQRTLYSLVPLKIKYGNGGYIDELTPLMTDSFLVDQTVNLLLIVP
jgi:hypothetical protein